MVPEPGSLLDEPDRGMSIGRRLWLSFRDMRAATRDLIDERPSEARLLFLVLLSDVIFFLSWAIMLVVAPGSETRSQLPAEVALMLILIFLCRTAVLYIFSALVGIVCRMAGGQGSWRDTRTGVFWASLAASPIGVLGALIGGMVLHVADGTSMISGDTVLLVRFCVGFAVFVFFLSAGVAEAQRFKNTSPVFIAFSVLAIGLAAALMAVTAKG